MRKPRPGATVVVPVTDGRLVEACVEELARYGGRPSGGMCRLAYTPEWQASVDQVASWLREEGLDLAVRVYQGEAVWYTSFC